MSARRSDVYGKSHKQATKYHSSISTDISTSSGIFNWKLDKGYYWVFWLKEKTFE